MSFKSLRISNFNHRMISIKRSFQEIVQQKYGKMREVIEKNREERITNVSVLVKSLRSRKLQALLIDGEKEGIERIGKETKDFTDSHCKLAAQELAEIVVEGRSSIDFIDAAIGTISILSKREISFDNLLPFIAEGICSKDGIIAENALNLLGSLIPRISWKTRNADIFFKRLAEAALENSAGADDRLGWIIVSIFEDIVRVNGEKAVQICFLDNSLPALIRFARRGIPGENNIFSSEQYDLACYIAANASKRKKTRALMLLIDLMFAVEYYNGSLPFKIMPDHNDERAVDLFIELFDGLTSQSSRHKIYAYFLNKLKRFPESDNFVGYCRNDVFNRFFEKINEEFPEASIVFGKIVDLAVGRGRVLDDQQSIFLDNLLPYLQGLEHKLLFFSKYIGYGVVAKSKILPKYESYKEKLRQIFENIEAEILIFKPNITGKRIEEILGKEADAELLGILQQAQYLREKYEYEEEGMDELEIQVLICNISNSLRTEKEKKDYLLSIIIGDLIPLNNRKKILIGVMKKGVEWGGDSSLYYKRWVLASGKIGEILASSFFVNKYFDLPEKTFNSLVARAADNKRRLEHYYKKLEDLENNQTLFRHLLAHLLLHGNLKYLVATSTPRFTALLREHGIKPEALDNLNEEADVGSIVREVRTLGLLSVGELKKLDNEVLDVCGARLADLESCPELLRIYADEIVQLTMDQVRLAAASSDENINGESKIKKALRLLGQYGGAKDGKARNNFRKGILGILGSLGIETQSLTNLKGEEFKKKVESRFSAAQETGTQSRRRALEKFIQRYSDLDYVAEGRGSFQLLSRGIADLGSGNTTMDCTNAKLESGFNFWTIPVWNSDRGMNMLFHFDPQKRVSIKMVFFVALIEGKPGIIVDSIEIGENFKEQEDREKDSGFERYVPAVFAKLLEIARRANINVNNIFVNRISNTGNLRYSLPVVAVNFKKLGGLLAVEEVAHALAPSEKVELEVYFQSVGSLNNEITPKVNAAISNIERIFALYIADNNVENQKRQELASLIRKKDTTALEAFLNDNQALANLIQDDLRVLQNERLGFDDYFKLLYESSKVLEEKDVKLGRLV